MTEKVVLTDEARTIIIAGREPAVQLVLALMREKALVTNEHNLLQANHLELAEENNRLVRTNVALSADKDEAIRKRTEHGAKVSEARALMEYTIGALKDNNKERIEDAVRLLERFLDP